MDTFEYLIISKVWFHFFNFRFFFVTFSRIYLDEERCSSWLQFSVEKVFQVTLKCFHESTNHVQSALQIEVISSSKKQLTFVLHFVAGSAQEASISYISPPQTKNPDESIIFNCTVVKPEDVNVSWLKDGSMLTLGSTAVFQNPRYQITVDESSNTYSFHVSSVVD